MFGPLAPTIVLAHALTESVRETSPAKLGVCIAAAVGGVIVLALMSPAAGREEREAESAYAKRVAHQRWLVRSIAGVVLLLAGIAAIPAFAFETTTRTVAHVENEVPTSTTDSALPAEFIGATSDGAVELSVENPNAVAIHMQCVIEALDDSGESVADGDYTEIDGEGRPFESENYSARFLVLPEEKSGFEANISLSGTPTSYTAACDSIPYTRRQIRLMEAGDIPFEAGAGAGAGGGS